MRIALVFSKYPPIEDGGADYLQHIANEFSNLGHTVGVYTSKHPKIVEGRTHSLTNNFEIFPIIDDWRLPITSRTSSWKILKDSINRFDPDIIFTIFPDSHLVNDYQLPLYISLFLPIPTVHLFFTFMFQYSNWTGKLIVAGMIFSADKIIVHSGHLQNYLKLPFFQKKTHLVPVGNNLAGVQASCKGYKDHLENIGLSSDIFTIGFYGGIDPSKGVEDMLEAFKLLEKAGEEIQLLFIGGRSVKNNYVRQIEKQIKNIDSPKIGFTGYLEQTQLVTYLETCDACLLPFRKNVLGRSSLASALSLGKPVITTKFDHDEKYLKHLKNAYLVKPATPEAIVDAVIHLKNEPELRKALSEGAKELSKEFAWDRIANQLIHIFNEVVDA